ALLDFSEKARCDLYPLAFGRIPGFTYPWIDPNGKIAATLVLEMPYHWNSRGAFGPPNARVRSVLGHNAVILSDATYASTMRKRTDVLRSRIIPRSRAPRTSG